jgi:hypothetical protein
MATAAFSNAIGWAQYRLLGGWRNLVSTTGAYALILCTLMFAFAHGLHIPSSRVYEMFIYLFFVLQVLVVLIYGTSRVSGAIRSDMNSRLIESHRLMPVAPFQAVLGYLFGAPLQAIAVYVVNFVLGAIAISGVGMRQQSWLFSNAILLIFCVFLWTILAFFSFRSNWAFGLFVIGLVAPLISPIQLLALVPGLKVLVSPMIGSTIFDLKTGLTIDWAFVFAVAAQVFIGLLYVLAAARRYWRDDEIGFTPIMGLLLLGAWVAVSAVEMLYPLEFRQRGPSMLIMHWPGAFVVSVLSCMLLAVLPIASATKASVIRSPAHVGRWMPPWLALALSFPIVLAIMRGAPPVPRASWSALLTTAVIVAAFLVSARCLLEIIYRLKLWPRRAMFIWLLLIWCVPMMLELIRQSFLVEETTDPNGPPMGILGMCSPIGSLVKIWGDFPQDVRGGVAFQVGVALVVVLAWALIRRRRSPALQPLPGGA